MKHLSNTTLVAVKYTNGIMVGSDMQTTLGQGIVWSRSTKKIHKVFDNLLILGSGAVDLIHEFIRLVKIRILFTLERMQIPFVSPNALKSLLQNVKTQLLPSSRRRNSGKLSSSPIHGPSASPGPTKKVGKLAWSHLLT